MTFITTVETSIAHNNINQTLRLKFIHCQPDLQTWKKLINYSSISGKQHVTRTPSLTTPKLNKLPRHQVRAGNSPKTQLAKAPLPQTHGLESSFNCRGGAYFISPQGVCQAEEFDVWGLWPNFRRITVLFRKARRKYAKIVTNMNLKFFRVTIIYSNKQYSL